MFGLPSHDVQRQCEACGGTGSRLVRLKREVESWKNKCESLRDEVQEKSNRLRREEATVGNLRDYKAKTEERYERLWTKLNRLRKKRDQETRAKKNKA